MMKFYIKHRWVNFVFLYRNKQIDLWYISNASETHTVFSFLFYSHGWWKGISFFRTLTVTCYYLYGLWISIAFCRNEFHSNGRTLGYAKDISYSLVLVLFKHYSHTSFVYGSECAHTTSNRFHPESFFVHLEDLEFIQRRFNIKLESFCIDGAGQKQQTLEHYTKNVSFRLIICTIFRSHTL